MRRPSAAAVLLVALVCAATVSAIDLRRVEHNTLVIYTTPALKDVLEKSIVPSFERDTGISVKLVYLPAGDQYYRVLMSRDRPEADLFLHASPLFIEKGYASGIFDAFPDPPGIDTAGTPQRPAGDGTHIWMAFAQSPLVEVYAQRLPSPPDLNHTSLAFGLPHPMLSNNGIYAALFFDATDAAAGHRAVDLTVVQPTNAQANIGGVADGSFDITLGYEAVARLFVAKGAKVSYSLPQMNGEATTTPVLFSVGLVKNHPHPGADRFIAHLFSDEVQDSMAGFSLRSGVPGHAAVPGGLDLSHARIIDYDWATWSTLERRLPAYVVSS